MLSLRHFILRALSLAAVETQQNTARHLQKKSTYTLTTIMMDLSYAAVPVIVGAITVLFHYCQPRIYNSSKGKVKNGIELPNSTEITTEDVKEKPGMQSYKGLYHKVQNLEDFPEILPAARQALLALLRQGFLLARLQNGPRSIMHISEYDPDQLAAFMAAKRQVTHDDWSSYLRRREAGGGPEMFASREAARQWLKENAPLQLVDGAWVARVHNITTPFALRGITKNAWQTYCEELGDGDLEKNHCFIYRELLREIGCDLPEQNDADLIHPRHKLDSDRIWRAAAGHLLISLFPNDFLPEILGFNLHYESLAPQTLKAAKELPEYGISGHYFAVHICIDNADSGHSAMAEATIQDYMDHMRKTGAMGLPQAWKRVQAGFLLSEYLDGEEDLNKYSEAVAEMLHSKAGVAGQIHCSSRARIGGRRLTEWFSADARGGINGHSWKNDFVAALARSKPWVYPGDGERGLLIRELSWKGRMFGAFTQAEVQRLQTWIGLLDSGDAADTERIYWKLIGRPDDGKSIEWSPSVRDAAVTHPAFPPQQEQPMVQMHLHEFAPLPPLNLTQVKLQALLPLWFVHPCILEQVVMSPYRTTTFMGSRVLQLLRAESGYMPENSGVAGMDEQREPSRSPSLTALGLRVAQKNGLPEPACLKDVLFSIEQSSSAATDFAYAVLGWAARPVLNWLFLLGLARAFLDLEAWVAGNETLLSKEERDALSRISARKEFCFRGILSEIQARTSQIEKFITGYRFGRMQIERILV